MTRLVFALPSGWCPIAANLLAQVADEIAGQPGTQDTTSAPMTQPAGICGSGRHRYWPTTWNRALRFLRERLPSLARRSAASAVILAPGCLRRGGLSL
jgi:predicted nucleic acid-binding Zn ribbon protein